MQQRIIGIDVARALAVVGMIIVNFKMVIGGEGSGFSKVFVSLFEGKAAATFVVLAGVGIALASNSLYKKYDIEKAKKVRGSIIKKALFLFIVGTSYLFVWPADILHFYGIYMIITLVLINQKAKTVLFAAIGLIFSYPILMLLFSYDEGWNFNDFSYSGFWTIPGFLRNLFYNGFHPVIPWTAFMLIGLWFGRQNLNDDRFVKKTLFFSLGIFSLTQLFSILSITILSNVDPKASAKLSQVLGTSPMPPLPIYMISGSSIATAVISLCILVGRKYSNRPLIDVLNKTGKMALTFYVAHVIVGMGLIEILLPEKMGKSTADFSLVYALLFSMICVIFAFFWLKKKKSGPLEYLMRKLTG